MDANLIYSDLKFRHTWRPYQQRVLNAIDQHLLDRKLHIVAAPGSGKTTLGLEIFRRLRKPALVLSPTRTIRDQWIHRLRDFVSDTTAWSYDWTSTDLSKPAIFTSVTYQALHSHYRDNDNTAQEQEGSEDSGDEEEKPLTQLEIINLASALSKTDIGTLILDEAHHLRAEWWKALTALVDRLPALTIVSLTATPPYDVVGQEWNRYQELCGPIDEEISVPELVRSETLCPHQDLVWTVEPLKSERQLVEQYDRSVVRLCALLMKDEIFGATVEDHPWITTPDSVEQEILGRPETAIALIVFLKAKEKPLPPRLMLLLDLEFEDVPCLDRGWWQTLLQAYLFDKQWPMHEGQREHRKELAGQMRAEHLLWRHELRLDESRLIKTRMTLSSAKIDACISIHREERRHRGNSLRQVILTDFIRDKNAHSTFSENVTSVGAWPIFSALIRSLESDQIKEVALLTGRLVIVHNDLLPFLREALAGHEFSTLPVDSLPTFSKVTDKSKRIVSGITSLLADGRLRTIVGTRSLLGEGWDAPAINSLVLASFVGSFMMTNQMRGRAIRIDKNQPQKNSSIWHIVG